MAARGAPAHVRVRRDVGIWICCSGRASMAARGTSRLVKACGIRGVSISGAWLPVGRQHVWSRAAYNGHLEVPQWARGAWLPVGEYMLICGERWASGCVSWAREHGCPWDEYTCYNTAAYGHLDVLQWAREHGCPWGASTCAGAAAGGHLDVLQWAREHGCPWGASPCVAAAAYNGHLEVLQWAQEHGCPQDTDT
ncbi:hypothetical protein CYMTET_31986 [Cymbomonas tetramitiformis]|uniref:Ankyrin repeat domain containing protein n=1 Tax=Cymbomonas tetramitiformis TaxID=36881 RepID=A0AAE0FFQ8_9CHLO|nr:hypothetical protein CYMTET_31986 [Cymbomonas tetramitiformis]